MNNTQLSNRPSMFMFTIFTVKDIPALSLQWKKTELTSYIFIKLCKNKNNKIYIK